MKNMLGTALNTPVQWAQMICKIYTVISEYAQKVCYKCHLGCKKETLLQVLLVNCILLLSIRWAQSPNHFTPGGTENIL